MQRVGLAGIAASMILGGLVATPAQAAATCFGERATIVGNERDNDITGTPGRDVIVAGGGNDVVHGEGGNDLIGGGSGEDRGLYGDAGNDRIHAGRSERTSLLLGGRGDDFLYDEPGGGDGNDRYTGGIGFDRAWFGASRTPVEVDVGRGSATGEGTESLDVESVVGSEHADTLTGSAGPDVLIAGPTRLSIGDVVRGLGGDDVLGVQGEAQADGGPGSDAVTYEFSTVTLVDLRTDSDSRGNTLTDIENVFGSNWSTGITIHGDEGPNVIGGSAGPDEIFGYGGDDVLDGRFGDDTIDGGEGTDTIDGGPSDQNDDNDRCVNGETVEDCES